jgi:hypothetical protein
MKCKPHSTCHAKKSNHNETEVQAVLQKLKTKEIISTNQK